MSMIKALSEGEYRRSAERAFQSVFRSADPFGEPLAPAVDHRALLYPVGYQLDPGELAAVADAARASGDDALFLSVTKRPVEAQQDRPYHCLIPFADLAAYRGLGYPFVLENALYSPAGKWGILISHEQHAVVGGAATFVDGLLSRCARGQAEQVAAFVSTWRDNHRRFGSDVAWVTRLLLHVFGDVRAEHRVTGALDA